MGAGIGDEAVVGASALRGALLEHQFDHLVDEIGDDVDHGRPGVGVAGSDPRSRTGIGDVPAMQSGVGEPEAGLDRAEDLRRRDGCTGVAAVAGDEEIVDEFDDVLGVGADGGVGRWPTGDGEHPAAEPVDGGDGGGVELVQRRAQTSEPQRAFSGFERLPIGPAAERHEHGIGGGDGPGIGMTGGVEQGERLEVGDGLGDALTDAAAQLRGGGLGEGDDAELGGGETELGDAAHGERREREGLAGAGTGLQQGDAARERAGQIEGVGCVLSHRRTHRWLGWRCQLGRRSRESRCRWRAHAPRRTARRCPTGAGPRTPAEWPAEAREGRPRRPGRARARPGRVHRGGRAARRARRSRRRTPG